MKFLDRTVEELILAGRFDSVAGITARAIIVEDESPDMHTVQSLVLCGAIREAFPLAPPGFEKIGRSATKADPGSLIVGTAPLTDSKEEGTDE